MTDHKLWGRGIFTGEANRPMPEMRREDLKLMRIDGQGVQVRVK
jgi:hypothetical protein